MLLALGIYIEFVLRMQLQANILYLMVAVTSGYNIMKKGLLALLKKRLDMNFLMTIAAVGAFSIGHGEEGASVVYLFFIAEFLEDYAGERARKSIGALIKVSVHTPVGVNLIFL